MSTVLSKVRRLEEYMASTDASSLDRVLVPTVHPGMRRSLYLMCRML